MKKFIFTLCVYMLLHQAYAQNWLITGNAGTSSANFIGTTDAQSLRFRTNNQVSGIIDYAAAAANTSLGFQSLRLNTGNNNTAFGYRSMWSNTTGRVNTALGAYSMYSNTTGFSNTALGIAALFSAKTLRNTVAVGDSALYYASFGANENTAVGSKSLCFTTNGYWNTAVGFQSLLNNAGGYSNTAIGHAAMRLNTYDHSSVAVGASALEYARFGFNNIAVGSLALLFDSAGYINTAIGSQAMYLNGDGDYNVAVGHQSLYNTISDKNTAVGVFSLYANATGTFNTSIGYSTSCTLTNLTNATALGALTSVTASNQVRVGSSAVTSIGGFANWTNISDGRVKKNIKDNVPGLAFINKLKPVTYNLDLDAADKIIQRPVITDAEGKPIATAAEELQAKNEKEKIVYSGFVAQQVEQAAKSIGYDFSGVDAAKNDKDLYGLRYAEFVVPLVKAVQELSSQNEKLKSQNDDQQKVNADLERRIEKLEALLAINTTSNNSQGLTISPAPGASLEQNVPNPFSGITTVNCYIPVNNGNAYVNFYSQTGNLLKSIKVTGEGKNTITLTANELAAGTYKYALVVDGKVMDSKTMVVQR